MAGRDSSLLKKEMPDDATNDAQKHKNEYATDDYHPCLHLNASQDSPSCELHFSLTGGLPPVFIIT